MKVKYVTIPLYAAIDSVQFPQAPDEGPPEFSVRFVAVQGKRKGQLLSIERAMINKSSVPGMHDRMKRYPESKNPNPRKRNNATITVRVIESKDISEPVISIKKLFITAINNHRTAL